MESSLCGCGFFYFVGGRGCFGRLLPLPLAFFPAPIPPTRARRALFPGGKGENHCFLMQGASPLASPGLGGKRHWRWAGRWRPAGACSSGAGRSIWVLQTRQKRLSRFCNTRHPSRHAGAQEKAGTGRERRGSINNNSFGKVLGVWGTLSRVPRRISAATQERKKAGTGHERRVTAIIIRSGKFWGVRGILSRVPRRIPVSPRIPARALQKRRNRPRGAVPGDDYSAVRPERSMPCTRKFWQKAYRMTSGRMIHRPQVFRIAA